MTGAVAVEVKWGWTYKLSRWNASDSEDITCFIVWIILIFTTILEYVDYLNMSNNFILMLLGMSTYVFSSYLSLRNVRCVILLGPARTRKWRLSTGLAVFLGVGGGDGVGGESIAFWWVWPEFSSIFQQVIGDTRNLNHQVSTHGWIRAIIMVNPPQKLHVVACCSVVCRMGLGHRWGLVS